MAIDAQIKAGTNRPITFRFPEGFDTAGKTFKLVVQWAGGRRVYTQSTGLSVTDARNVLWTYSLADSREFPAGRIAKIDLEWTQGGIQDSDSGMLEVMPGISDD